MIKVICNELEQEGSFSQNFDLACVIQVCIPFLEREGDSFWRKEITGSLSFDSRGVCLNSASLGFWQGDTNIYCSWWNLWWWTSISTTQSCISKNCEFTINTPHPTPSFLFIFWFFYIWYNQGSYNEEPTGSKIGCPWIFQLMWKKWFKLKHSGITWPIDPTVLLDDPTNSPKKC